MNLPPLVPPIKCQGIKTKLVADIRQLVDNQEFVRWVEPFCGSCVVPLNLQPPRALLCDSNIHIVRLYRDIQQHKIGAADVRDFLREEGAALSTKGEDHFYQVRERFNSTPNSLDFLFLNRSCFNGVMRFNKRGRFNVPFCRKPDRFAPAYITKISNQVSSISLVISQLDWEFRVSGFKETLSEVTAGDLVYADPRMREGMWTTSIAGLKETKRISGSVLPASHPGSFCPPGTATSFGQIRRSMKSGEVHHFMSSQKSISTTLAQARICGTRCWKRLSRTSPPNMERLTTSLYKRACCSAMVCFKVSNQYPQ